MQNFKYFFVFIFALILASSLISCAGIVQKKEARGIEGNGISEGGSAKAQQNVEEIVDGNFKWPTKEIGNLPRLKGTINGITKEENSCNISIENVSEQDAEKYMEMLRGKFSDTKTEYATKGVSLVYMGSGADYDVMFTYSYADKFSVLMLAKKS